MYKIRSYPTDNKNMNAHQFITASYLPKLDNRSISFIPIQPHIDKAAQAVACWCDTEESATDNDGEVPNRLLLEQCSEQASNSITMQINRSGVMMQRCRVNDSNKDTVLLHRVWNPLDYMACSRSKSSNEPITPYYWSKRTKNPLQLKLD